MNGRGIGFCRVHTGDLVPLAKGYAVLTGLPCEPIGSPDEWGLPAIPARELLEYYWQRLAAERNRWPPSGAPFVALGTPLDWAALLLAESELETSALNAFVSGCVAATALRFSCLVLTPPAAGNVRRGLYPLLQRLTAQCHLRGCAVLHIPDALQDAGTQLHWLRSLASDLTEPRMTGAHGRVETPCTP